MRRKLPPFNGLRAFDAVARCGTIAGAARELLLTESAVSRAVKNLEDHFGLALFDRHASGLLLTEHGKVLVPEVTAALDKLAAASSLIYEQRRYSVSVLATPFMASRWIAPLIAEFTEAHPDVSIRIHSSFRYEELQRADFDVAIWNGPGIRSGYARRHLFDLERIPICQTSIAGQLFRAGEAKALEEAPLIHEYDYADWMAWFETAGLEASRAARGLVTDNFEAGVRATTHGAGVALLFRALLDDPEIGPRICAPIPAAPSIATEYWLHQRKDPALGPAIERFSDFLSSRTGDLTLTARPGP